MTTTDDFQVLPDYYTSKSECSEAKRKKVCTNPRYTHFKQTHFTAGDESQFQKYRSMTNGQVCIPVINLNNNRFRDINLSLWIKYQNLNATCVTKTFRYMFNKMKKGIFIKIQDNKLKVFLPFSKDGFINEWSNKIKIDPSFGNMYNFAKYINKLGNKRYRVNVTQHADHWYANNCLVRYENPINEGDTNVPNMSDMIKNLCEHRKVPDIEFFINRRDFPIIKRNNTEAYEHIFGDNQPLLSHEYDQYAPILSMVTTKDHADIPIPTGDDWARITSKEGRFFTNDCKTYPQIEEFNIKWDDKKPTAVWRGASTGCGVNTDTNIRLKLSYLSVTTPHGKDGPLLDAGISKWQLRARKLKNHKYLQTIDVPAMNKLGIFPVSFLSPLQQSGYKYLVHVDGHVSAFRLSLELSMGCCILKADSMYKLWYSELLEPMVHYVPVNADLSNLVEKIEWCRNNDDKCKQIAVNARAFYVQYLQKDGALDYLQKLITDLKNQSGVYLYNTETPLHRQIRLETEIGSVYPITAKTVADINTIPRQSRSFGILKGLEWVINMINDKSVFSSVAKKGEVILENKTVTVQKYTLAGFSFVVKSTTDKDQEMENIHEAYVGTNSINEVVKYTPNFSYVFGKYTKSTVIVENIFGISFHDWIHSDRFNMKDYIFILIQISMALEVAQKQVGFVHWDLTPLNIMIQMMPTPIDFDYMIDEKTVYRVNTRIIPVIIQYGKSHVIHNNEHHGFINMYKVSTIQDVLSLLITSLNSIIKLKLSKTDIASTIKLANFLSGTGYRRRPFRETGPKGVSDINYFISRVKRYTELVSSDKHELEDKTPLDFIYYIEKNFKYAFSYEKIDYPLFRIYKGNPRQVYEYILSNTQAERIQSFVNVFERVITCEFPEPINLFFSYYSTQTIEDNLTSVHTLMTRFLEKEGVDTAKYDRMYKKAIQKVKKIYTKKLKESDDEKIEFDVLQRSPYDEHTFLTPDVIYNLLTHDIKRDLSEYKHVIERVLINQGMFKLTEEHKEYYLRHFKKLLLTNSLVMQNNTANAVTLYNTAKDLYTVDRDFLKSRLPEEIECGSVDDYMLYYNKIIDKHL